MILFHVFVLEAVAVVVIVVVMVVVGLAPVCTRAHHDSLSCYTSTRGSFPVVL